VTTCWHSFVSRLAGALAHDLEHYLLVREVRYAKRTIKLRTNSVGIIPNDVAIIRLVGSQLLEQQVEKWQLEGRRFFSVAIMAKIPQPEVLIDLTIGDPAQQAALGII
jgi:hypothetical protein